MSHTLLLSVLLSLILLSYHAKAESIESNDELSKVSLITPLVDKNARISPRFLRAANTFWEEMDSDEDLGKSKGSCTWGFSALNGISANTLVSSGKWKTVGADKIKAAATIGRQHLSYTCGLNSAARVFKMFGFNFDCDDLVTEYNPYLSINLFGIKVGAKPKDLCRFVKSKIGNEATCEHSTFETDADAASTGVQRIKNGIDAGAPTIIVMFCDWKSMHYVTIVGYNDNEFTVWNTNTGIFHVPIETVLHWMKIDAGIINVLTGLKRYEFLTIYKK